MNVVEWKISEQEEQSKALRNRNQFAKRKERLPILEVILLYTHFLPWQLEKMLSDNLLAYKEKILGRGIELGAGTGLLSTQLTNLFENIEEIYLVEYVDEIVNQIQPRVIAEYAKYPSKLRPAIGSFDDILLERSSVDFMIQIESLHHSPNLETTFAELSRVLKPGGLIFNFDRVQPDDLSDEQIEIMLDVEYSHDFKLRYGYPVDEYLNRRMNGEQEYRRFEWERAVEEHGLQIIDIRNLRRGPDRILNSLKRLMGLEHDVTPKMSKKPLNELRKGLLRILKPELYSPKELTFLVIKKA